MKKFAIATLALFLSATSAFADYYFAGCRIDLTRKYFSRGSQFHDFNEMNESGELANGKTVCWEASHAIAYTRRIYEGDSPNQAAKYVARKGGTCRDIGSIELTPFGVSVRGDPEGRSVTIIVYKDGRDNCYFEGIPTHE